MRWRVLPSELSIITVKSRCLEKGVAYIFMRVTHHPGTAEGKLWHELS
jgi:hypothetical protein